MNEHETALRKLKLEMEHIAGLWDGDKVGRVMERAQAAAEVMDKCDELITLLDELNDL